MSLPDWQDANLRAAAPFLDKWAATLNLPRDVVYGLVSQESRFVATAYRFEPAVRGLDGSTHPDASYGLTQILFGTAQGLGYTGTPEGLFDPDTNCQYGLQYLANKLASQGNLFDALSAYNAGSIGTVAGSRYATEVLVRIDYFTTLFANPAAAAAAGNTGISGIAPSAGLIVLLIVGLLLLIRAVIQ